MAMVLVVAGRVRRGELFPATGLCDECGRAAAHVLTSKRGLVTLLCPACVVACGEPRPVEVGGVLCDSVHAVRMAIVEGRLNTDTLRALAAAERFERDAKRWERQTRPHGFKHVKAQPKRDASGIGLWLF